MKKKCGQCKKLKPEDDFLPGRKCCEYCLDRRYKERFNKQRVLDAEEDGEWYIRFLEDGLKPKFDKNGMFIYKDGKK